MIEIRPLFTRQPGLSAGTREPSSRLPALLKNEIVQGKVIHVLAHGDAVVAIKDRTVIARSHVPLENDQVLVLRVEQTRPTPLLRLLGTGGQFPGASSLMHAVEVNPWRRVLKSLGKSTVLSREHGLLRDLLEDLSLLLSKPRDRDPLREWIERSGLCLENRLRGLVLQGRQNVDEVNRLVSGDLKGLLARTLHQLHQEDGASPMVERLFSLIENLQWFNHGSLDQAGKLFLLLPCQGPDDFWTVAQLLIQKEEGGFSKGLKRAKACRMVFLSEFSNLGWVRGEIRVEGEEVRLRFLTGSADSTCRLEGQLPVLIGHLKERGFRVSALSCGTLDPDLLKHTMVQELTAVGAASFSAFA